MKIVPLTIAITLTLAVSGCATTGVAGSFLPGMAQPSQAADDGQEKPRTDKRRLFKAGGIGCLTGGLMGLLGGDKDAALKGCLAGAVVGGIVDWRAQVNEAREVEKAAQAAGMKAEVRTAEATDQDGQKGQKLESLVIDFDPADMTERGPKTVAMLDRLGALLSKAKNELVVTFEGRSGACSIPYSELNARGALENHKAELHCGFDDAHRITVTPLPDVR